MDPLENLIIRAERLVRRVEALLPPVAEEAETGRWDTAIAFRWIVGGTGKVLQPVHHPDHIQMSDLLGIEQQKQLALRNTQQFLAGLPANNLLAWGSRGTGKSSLIKALLNRFHGQGLRLVEVDKHLLQDLPVIAERVARRPEKFILYCDDLSFDSSDPAYKSLKVALDGSLDDTAENLLIYATSNRRHLLPEYMADNHETRHERGEIHFSEAVEEKLALSDRFGIWLSFQPFSQEQYLDIVDHWLKKLECPDRDHPELREEALRWALRRGSRSGRTALQFARDWAGARGLAVNSVPHR